MRRTLWYTQNMRTATKQSNIPVTPRRTVPKEWKRVAGILKGRLTEDPVTYQRRTRKESDAREKRTTKLASK
jgi:hypothetical protein